MPFEWFAQLYHTFLRFVMQKDDSAPEMRVFSKARDVTNASLLLRTLKENHPFLEDGLGNIIVTQVEYCKCCLSKGHGNHWEHEFLLVTLKESVGPRRTAFLIVDRLIDDRKEYAEGQDGLLADIAKHQREAIIDIEATESTESTDSNSTVESPSRASPAAQQWTTPSYIQRSGDKFKRSKGDLPNAIDRLIILPNKRAVARELDNHPFDILMTMDLTRSQNHRSVTLEHFAHLLRTTSRNTPQYHYIFAQCYWYAYTIWRVLEIETQPHIRRFEQAERQCSYSGYGKSVVLGKGEFVNMVRSPETIRAQWEAEKPAEDQRWAEKKQVSIITTAGDQISLIVPSGTS